MLQDLKERVEQVNRDAGFMSLTTLAVYDGVFDFGEDMKGAVAHFSAELERAARLMNSPKKHEQADGLVRATEIARALSLLVKNTDPWAYYDDLKPGEKIDSV